MKKRLYACMNIYSFYQSEQIQGEAKPESCKHRWPHIDQSKIKRKPGLFVLIKPLVILPESAFTNPGIALWRKPHFLKCGKENHEIYGHHITWPNIDLCSILWHENFASSTDCLAVLCVCIYVGVQAFPAYTPGSVPRHTHTCMHVNIILLAFQGHMLLLLFGLAILLLLLLALG